MREGFESARVARAELEDSRAQGGGHLGGEPHVLEPRLLIGGGEGRAANPPGVWSLREFLERLGEMRADGGFIADQADDQESGPVSRRRAQGLEILDVSLAKVPGLSGGGGREDVQLEFLGGQAPVNPRNSNPTSRPTSARVSWTIPPGFNVP